MSSLRGNVDTRLRKALDGPYDAIVLAGAGLVRLGLEEHITEWLPLEIMLPAPGQGALAVQCRRDDSQTLAILATLEDRFARQVVTAERAFLQELGGGCAMPVAAYAMLDPQVNLTGSVASPDGLRLIRLSTTGIDPQKTGACLARQALREGAAEILQLLAEEDTHP
jgi:hydroxymethylbilane synthase